MEFVEIKVVWSSYEDGHNTPSYQSLQHENGNVIDVGEDQGEDALKV